MPGQTNNHNRNARHKRNRRKRNWFRIAVHCLALALVAELVSISLTSPRLRIARIDISGTKAVSVSDIQRRTAWAMGRNIFLVDARAVGKSARGNPAVRIAKVYRRPLNRLVVRIDERVPFAAVVAGGKTYLMDSDGFVFAEAPSAPKGAVQLELIGSPPLRVGTRPNPKLVSSCFDCLQRAGKSGFKVGKISVDPGNNMCLNMESGLWVKLGQPFDLDNKFVVWKNVLTQKPEIATQALYLDLRCATAPAWKGRDTSPTL